MDTTIDITRYKPTRVDWHDGAPSYTGIVEENLGALVQHTLSLQREPNQAKNWTFRGQVLSQLGYPELALGDLWKADYCHTLLSQSRVPEQRRSAVVEQERVPEDSNNLIVAPISVHESAFPDHALQVSARHTAECYQGEECRFVPRPYPWLRSEHNGRSTATIEEVNIDLERTWPQRTDHGITCKVTDLGSCESRNANLGIFARRAFAKGVVVLADRTDLTGLTAGHQYPLIIGGRDMSWLHHYPHANWPRTILKLKCLAESIAAGTKHPLDHPLLARLRATYHDTRQRCTSWNEIAATNLALIKLGVDVLADHNYDTWILFTIDARLENNLWSEPDASYLSPSFAMINHSCAPNLDRRHDRHREKIVLTTNRSIAAGEQLFVTYNAYIEHLPVAERRAALRQWLDIDCTCPRCTAEEAQTPPQPETSEVVDLALSVKAFW